MSLLKTKLVFIQKTSSPYIYRRVVRRKANLEVTDVEKPKTRLRRRKANKRHLSQAKKSQFAPSPDEKLQQTVFCA